MFLGMQDFDLAQNESSLPKSISLLSKFRSNLVKFA